MIYENSLSFVEKLDQSDPLRSYRNKFHYPKDKNGNEVLYLCSNSLGLQPKTAKAFVEKELNVWEKDGVLGQHGRWEKFHERLIHPSARLVGAKPSEVVAMNTLTVNLHLMMVSFYKPTSKRHKIIIEADAFPSDIYAVESQIKYHGFSTETSLIKWSLLLI